MHLKNSKPKISRKKKTNDIDNFSEKLSKIAKQTTEASTAKINDKTIPGIFYNVPVSNSFSFTNNEEDMNHSLKTIELLSLNRKT